MKKITCSNGNEYIDYKSYLKSKEWKNKRIEYFKENEKSCKKCGSKENIHLHHMTYENIGKEKLTDLISLCSECHKEAHCKKTKTINSIKRRTKKKNKPLQKIMCKNCRHFRYESYCLKHKKTPENYYKPRKCKNYENKM